MVLEYLVQAVAPAPSDEVIQTTTSKTWCGDDGVVRQVLLLGAQVDLECAQRDLRAGARCGNESSAILVDLRGLGSVTRQAREHFGRNSPLYFRAAGLVVGNGFSSVIGNFFVGITNPSLPIRLFHCPEIALRWLHPKNATDILLSE